MVHAAHFVAGLLACYLTTRVLVRSTLAWRVPTVAILCWQAAGLALGLCTTGLLITLGLIGYHRSTGSSLVAFTRDLWAGTLPPWLGALNLLLLAIGIGVAGRLLSATIHILVRNVRAQQQHRDLLALVARDDPAVPGALVLDHPSAAAYTLPGVRPQVVVSVGALSLLDAAELAAVLRHERAHAAERHDLVLLPFAALQQAMPWSGWAHIAHRRVALLVEMRADDRARKANNEAPLVEALRRFAAADHRFTPACTLGLGDQHIDVRVQRLLVTTPKCPSRQFGTVALSTAALGVAALLVALPVSLFLN